MILSTKDFSRKMGESQSEKKG